MLLRLIIAHTLPYTNPILQFLAFFFAFLTTEDGTDMLSSMSVRNYHFFLRYNPEKQSFRTVTYSQFI